MYSNLWERCVPIYIITDCDAAGYAIGIEYKYGSQNTGFYEGSHASTAIWLGLSPQDLDHFNISTNMLSNMTGQDHALVAGMLVLDDISHEEK
ncbi:endodeoxyribonuclease [Puccinia graminis f. sp. tritici]|uniref:Endodeoxyribonuclease n=1 Tax=Puccinia graminis f. sp. tritici TaxID=56615 RepID=A0A5B0NU88_PUCGR|nr:endodeoxyribonuclease [Puccinia graminis f. sp. tritici]